MKALKSFALASLSFVAVSGVQADEPVKAQRDSQNQVSPPHQQVAQSNRHRSRQQLSALQSPAPQQQNPVSAAQPPAKVNDQPVIKQPRRGLFSRLLGGPSRYSSSIPISQATVPAASSSQAQPLPHAN